MRYNIEQIATIAGGQFLSKPDGACMEHVLLDSRQVIFPASSIFIALQGRRHDGHSFLDDLYQQGVRHFLVSKKIDTDAWPGAVFVWVENTLGAFQQLAAYHRSQFSLPVIGITGSNGKTIVKEWLFQLLYEDYYIVRSPRSYNSQTGAPLSVLQITPEHTLGIFEAGISQMGEMEKIAPILDPGIGIFTNIGEAHSEGFPDMETKLQQKLLLFKNTRTLICCLDDERMESAVFNWQSSGHSTQSAARKSVTWSATGKEADLKILSITPKGNSTQIEGVANIPHPSSLTPPKTSSINIPFTDSASLQNAVHCWALMLHLGYEHETIARRMSRLEPVAMRLELRAGINGCTIINDSYNSDLTSLKIALDFLEQQGRESRRTLILSDIFQSGQKPEQLYRTVAQLLLEKKMDRIIGIGKEVAVLEKFLTSRIQSVFYENTPAFLADLQGLVFRDEVILLKGARKFGFEKIANRLATRFHKTVLEVNLGALLNNLRVYQSQLRPGTKLMVMVKAGAYGSGSAEVAKLLEFQNVDYLGVAYADEGVELRKAGIQLPIMVMNPEEATFDALVRYRLEPEIYSLKLLENFLHFLENLPQREDHGAPAAAIGIHLKLDTGMHRLGLEENDIEKAISLLEQTANSEQRTTIKSTLSHLAASEAPAHDDFTRQQVARFEKMYEKLAAGLGYRPLRHILNSSGIARFPEYQMDMVRLGIGLYGIDGSGRLQGRLQTVNSLKATVSQIKNVRPGETVGYGRMGKAEKPMRIATLSLGYADGLLRRAGNGRFSVLIKGKRAPLFGNVCMDMVMADATPIPDAEEGDQVVIFGKDSDGNELPVQELAASLDTIPYEIFTSISDRVKRVYVQE
ncbi:MAG: bifunctional UDP-N-acetylmuramoyl-tripeptide:D-alanyl-D-alanine ligase/alanine racemase [Saprospiraceae bacterium]